MIKQPFFLIQECCLPYYRRNHLNPNTHQLLLHHSPLTNANSMLCSTHLLNIPQPAVISAIMKQQMTHRMRSVVNDGMDILGGAGNKQNI